MSNSTKTLADFAAKFGISAICRRHFGYEKPVSDAELGGYPTRGALTYMRVLDPGRLALTFKEGRKAYEQGEALAKLDIEPDVIITGIDQRNRDGGRFTAEGIADQSGQSPVPVYTSPAVTYPHYTSFEVVRAALERYGDYAVHAYLAGAIPGLWSESPATFEQRILGAVTESCFEGDLPLYDLNFEQITLLKFRLVDRIERSQIPYTKGSWVPTMGGGVVVSRDKLFAMEFRPDLTLVNS